MTGIRGRLLLGFAAVSAVTAAAALNLALVYFERRLAGLPPAAADAVERRLSVAGGDFDGLLELSGVLAASLAAGLLTALLLARRLTRGVRAVAVAARRVAAGDLAARAGGPGGRDELARLAADFDAMAAGLQALERERAATAAAIAHELRTPLAALTARLQALRDGVLPLDGDEPQRLLRHTGVLGRLVEDLRTLSLADAGRLRLDRRRTDLRATVADAVAAHAVLAAARDVRLAVADLPDAAVTADVDADRLAQVLGNLLDNAVRHSPPGGRVTVRLGRAGADVALTVDDEGPGVAPGDRERVFDRFTALDPARGTGGGLGLAVVRALVAGHGGTVELTGAPGGGARARVTLPAS